MCACETCIAKAAAAWRLHEQPPSPTPHPTPTPPHPTPPRLPRAFCATAPKKTTHQGDALQHADGADDEGKVGRDAEGVVKRDLGQVSGQLLEVDGLGTAALCDQARRGGAGGAAQVRTARCSAARCGGAGGAGRCSRERHSGAAARKRHSSARLLSHAAQSSPPPPPPSSSHLQRLVKHLGQHRQDGAQVGALGDELQRHKVLHPAPGQASTRMGGPPAGAHPTTLRADSGAKPASVSRARMPAPSSHPPTHLHNRLVVAMNQVTYRLDHAVLDACSMSQEQDAMTRHSPAGPDMPRQLPPAPTPYHALWPPNQPGQWPHPLSVARTRHAPKVTVSLKATAQAAAPPTHCRPLAS